jgi:hypothetical protein
MAAALAVPTPGSAQVLPAGSGAASGRVVQASNARGVGGAFLLAFDGNGNVVGQGLSGQEGIFVIVLPAGGPYRLEVESMGYRIATADSLRIPVSDTLRIDPILLQPDTVATPREPGPGLRAYMGP